MMSIGYKFESLHRSESNQLEITIRTTYDLMACKQYSYRFVISMQAIEYYRGINISKLFIPNELREWIVFLDSPTMGFDYLRFIDKVIKDPIGDLSYVHIPKKGRK